MRYVFLPILILGLTAALTAAAIEFLPQTAYFPAVEYALGDTFNVTMHRTGEMDRAACERVTDSMVRAIRAFCPQCKLAAHCARGLDASQRRILSREPIPMPSARQAVGGLTITIAAGDPAIAMALCQQVEAQSAGQPPNQRLTCYRPGTAR